MAQAIADGTVLAPRAQGSRKMRFGTKPKFYDAWVTPGGDQWENMMVSAQNTIWADRVTYELLLFCLFFTAHSCPMLYIEKSAQGGCIPETVALGWYLLAF